jgi:flagellar motility protein MotE (MotC chaperone)
MKPDIELTPEPQPILANNPSVFFANNRPMPFPSESEIKVLSEGHAFNEEGLKIRLKKYIARIESYANNTETIAFGEDFCQWGILKMKDSRARNRDANYRLAKELLRELEDGHDVPEVFRDLEGKRDKYKQLTNHTLGIHSSELKSIIKDANNMIRKRATLR